MHKLSVFTIISLISLSIFTACGASGHNDISFGRRTGSAIKKPNVTEITEEQVTSEPKDNGDDTFAAISNLYIIESIDMNASTIRFYSMTHNRRATYKYNMTTRFEDKYGHLTGVGNFQIGSMVTIGSPAVNDLYVKEVKMTDVVWKQDDITRYAIDNEHGVFKIGDTNYRILPQTLVYSADNPTLISEISGDDVLSVTGYGKDILTVTITTGHGYLSLLNTGVFEGTLVKIGNKVVTNIYAGEIIDVPEGTYDITVASDGWGGVGSVTIKRNEITEFDLDTIKGEGPKYCELTVQVGLSDAYVYVDNELIPADEPTKIKYGNHILKIMANGYSTWKRRLVVNSSSATISVDLSDFIDNSGTTSDDTNITEDIENPITTDDSEDNNSNSSTNNNNSTHGNTTGNIPSTQDLINALQDSVLVNPSNNTQDYEVQRLSNMANIISDLF